MSGTYDYLQRHAYFFYLFSYSNVRMLSHNSCACISIYNDLLKIGFLHRFLFFVFIFIASSPV